MQSIQSFFLIFFIVHQICVIDALDNGVARTPPMGWSTWNYYKLGVNESVFYNAVKYMTQSGMKDVGYEYINVDAGWWEQAYNSTAKHYQLVRNSSGHTTYSHLKYPNSIQSVIKYIHDNGFKYGHYTDAGVEACSGELLLSENYKVQDISLFIEWGIDMLKIDSCNVVGNMTANIFEFYDLLSPTWNLNNSINSTTRPVLFSNCHNECVNDDSNSKFVNRTWKAYCIDRFNMWRVSTDIKPNWKTMLHNIDCVKYFGKYGQPGAWNVCILYIVCVYMTLYIN